MKQWLNENWFKLGILILLFVLGISVSVYFLYLLPKERRLFLTKETNLELQDKCAKQASRFFVQKWGVSPEGMTADYTSHFNNTLNKCFIEIRSTENQTGFTANTYHLFDAYEGVQYGIYRKLVNSGDTRIYDSIPPQECIVSGRSCNSNAEYTSLTQQFFTE